MITTVEDATSSDVAELLVRLREEGGVNALGRVLTLVVLADDDAAAERAVAAANAASREHPCRVLVVVRPPAGTGDRDGFGDGTGLSAEVRVGADAGASEVVLLRPRGRAAAELDTLLVPLLLPDAPIVTWWPAEPPAVPSQDPVGAMAQRRITEVAACAQPVRRLRDLARGYTPGDTDLSWSRITLWRGLVAAALDVPPHEPVTAATVKGATNRPSLDLLAGWLADRLGCPVTLEGEPTPRHITEVRLDRPGGPIVIRREVGSSVARITRPDVPDQYTNLPLRTLEDCLMEDLRRLDPDETYGETLTGGLSTVIDVRGGGA